MVYFNSKEVRNWIHSFKFYRPVFITGVLNDYLGYGTNYWTLYNISKNNRHFFNELHRRVYKNKNINIPRLSVIEKGKGRFHSHFIIDTPTHYSLKYYIKLLKRCWLKTNNGIEVNIKKVYNVGDLRNYLSKEIYHNNDLGVDVFNSFKNEVV